MDKFTLGKIQVDVKRNQIMHFDHVVSLEPKVMDVLHYLALNQGKVVSQEELFSALWPASLFNSGIILRCIAQLRKALGDDGKKQAIIGTFPKRGYSLKIEVEVEVKPEKIETSPKKLVTSIPQNHSKYKFYSIVTLTLIALLVFLFFKDNDSTESKTKFHQLTPITSTNDYEAHASFSPVDNRIAFIRTDDHQQSHLWIKDLNSIQVQQISRISQNFISIAWANDGKAIAYLSENSSGYELGFFDLPTVMPQHLDANILSQLPSDTYLGAIQWFKNNLYYLSTPKDDLVLTKSKIFSYDMVSQTSHLIWQQNDDFSPYDMSLSPDGNSLALSGYLNSFHTDVKVFDLNEKSLTPLIKGLPEYTEVTWHPSGNSILLSDSSSLKLVDMESNIHAINWQNYRQIESPHFDSTGNKIALALSITDVDILLQPVDEKLNVLAISNSSATDYSARLSPDGDAVVYLSNRMGYQQVFLYNNNETQLIFENKNKSRIENAPLWYQNGTKILLNLDNELLLVDTITKLNKPLAKPNNLSYLYSWFNNENSLLVDYKSDLGISIAKYDIEHEKITTLATGNIKYAHLSINNELIVIKNNKIIKINQNSEEVLFSPAEKKEIVASVIHDNGLMYQLNFVNDNGESIRELWQLDLKNNSSALLEKLPHSFAKILDTSPDGKQRIFLSHAKEERDIVLLE